MMTTVLVLYIYIHIIEKQISYISRLIAKGASVDYNQHNKKR